MISNKISNPMRYSLTTRFKDRHIMNMMKPLLNKKVLDVGSGIGYLSEMVNNHNGMAYGVDIEPDAINYCKKNIDGQFEFGSAYKLPYDDNYFDYIILADVIEHIEHPTKVLDEIKRVAKNKAEVIISTPNLKGWLTGTWVLSMLHEEEDENMVDHEDGYTREGLEKLLNQNNIIPNEIKITNPLISQLFIGLIKLGYKSEKNTYTSQYQLIDLLDNWKFQIYKYTLFPVGLFLGRVEESLLGNLIPGHCLIIKGIINKG